MLWFNILSSKDWISVIVGARGITIQIHLHNSHSPGIYLSDKSTSSFFFLCSFMVKRASPCDFILVTFLVQNYSCKCSKLVQSQNLPNQRTLSQFFVKVILLWRFASSMHIILKRQKYLRKTCCKSTQAHDSSKLLNIFISLLHNFLFHVPWSKTMPRFWNLRLLLYKTGIASFSDVAKQRAHSYTPSFVADTWK